MNETPKKKRRTVRTTPGKSRKAAGRIVVTLSLPKGDVVKVEKLAKSGQRHKVSEREFSALAGKDEMEDLGAALEEIYAAGITDAIDNDLADDGLDEDEQVERFILREAAGREFARRGLRRLIVRKVLRRELVRRRMHPVRRATHDGASGHRSPP